MLSFGDAVYRKVLKRIMTDTAIRVENLGYAPRDKRYQLRKLINL